MERRFMEPAWRKKYRLIDMTTANVKRWLEKTDIVLFPVGSLEQHGRIGSSMFSEIHSRGIK